ncbi:topoisomerase DNA-binding C4 zinc finger domain-containing protein [Desulfosarcina ovata]|uniref:DNA topoisomerase type IA zn finger domain-containing protein n=1 Tax=Desulfosarcina ovata subsp. ovata TaxID=2752305 RepID=A0A5K8A8K8_9BACT|nr:topoisomerase DNA-binding C4 zinc finger domain-containing protein [Desulfosarcina ovata]BBO88674.1 hypothetical protein DSCOOX_18540 [Desulfosarcina ovata subsp. ovata]
MAVSRSIDDAGDADQPSRCPACGADAYYRYGKTANGKARRICLLCQRQYTIDGARRERPDRPVCPLCGEPMHVYRRQAGFTRYRCRNYPACRSYVKVADEKGG